IGLLDFIKSEDPFKVKIGERTLADNEDPLPVDDAVDLPCMELLNENVLLYG
nr:hypothetical protein [Tanacetum cinerariifolium]